ncbi:hypothetical protein KR084_003086, partial [Drosophila pseudotakahashii]
DGNLNELLLAQLECPVCFGQMMTKIEQCKNGHIICNSCRQKVTTCPVCREELTNIRNFPMEKLASRLIYPCLFLDLGCPDRIPFADKARHELHCEYRPYPCPFSYRRCPWTGSLNSLFRHQADSHSDVVTKEGSTIIFEIGDETRRDRDVQDKDAYIMIQSCHGRHFVLCLTKIDFGDQNRIFWIACRIVGGDEDAKAFFYKISLMANGEQLQREGKTGAMGDYDSTTDVMFMVRSNEEFDSANGEMQIEVTVIKGQMEEQ